MRSARWRLLWLLGSAGCVPGMSGPTPRLDERAELRHVIDSMLAAPEVRHARWGVLIVDPDRGDTLYSHDAGKLFVPASNMKIITAAVALEVLGPDFRFRTPVLARGPVQDGVLLGDLLVVGRGDPSVSDHVAGDAMIPLNAVAEAIAARGITRIAGSVLPWGNAFPDATIGFGWPLDDLEFAYSAPVDELLFNEGYSEIHVRAGAQPNDPPEIWTRPARSYPPLRIAVTTTLRGTGEDSLPQVEAVKDTMRGDVLVSGTIPAGDSAVRIVTHRDPAQAYVAALREALADHGIAIGDSAFVADSAAVADTVHVLESPPLSQILGFFMKPSQNQIGEMLFKSVGLAVADTGTVRVARRIVAEQLATWGAQNDGSLIWGGSGLSRRDMLSPETIVRVLDVMRRGPHFETYHDAFPVAGVDGTLRLRMRGTVGEANVRGKTGTLGSVRSLSGYVTTAGGQQLLFSVLANNFLVGTERISRVQDTIAVRLARLRVVTGSDR
ncbi:MAG: D-alanyl-D-alanine carboxypeptidase/D-alanyl-D-alanine-endopeptidase [Gemmatimonadaceae bacterium]